MLRFSSILLGIMLVSMIDPCHAENGKPAVVKQPTPPLQLTGYSTNPPAVKNLISKALHLSQLNLTYIFGSANPKNKGMDCSGAIYYLLNQEKIQHVPRRSDEQFDWVEKKGTLHNVNSNDFNSTDFSKLKPGDLLFWSGTYVTNRDSPISHVMLYLGKNKKGQRLMFGSTNGRTYQGKRMLGVGVFNFKLPSGNGPQRFVGYGCIPGLTCNKTFANR